MSHIMRLATVKLRLALATMLCIAATGAYAAADAPAAAQTAAPGAAAQPGEPLEQLREVWVRGKRLVTAIADAEDDFFKLYNQLNRNSDYDITCGSVSMRPGSLIMVRTCMPQFIVDGLRAARAVYAPNYSPVFTGSTSCYGYMGGAYSGYNVNGDQYQTITGGGYSCQPATAPVFLYVAPPAPPVGSLLLERGPAYTANVLQVINSDERLRSKYDHLVGLYHELEATQQRFVKTRGNRATLKPNPGPRAF